MTNTSNRRIPFSTTTTAPSSTTIASFYDANCIYFLPMLGWFVFSAALSSYNKYIFGDTHLFFPCPLLLTSLHFLIQHLVSLLVTSSAFCTNDCGGRQISSLSWNSFLSISIPCGLVTSADVGLSNLALVRISMTFYTMVKSSAPIFVVCSAYIFGIERITWMLVLVVALICMGEVLTVLGEVEFNTIGFLLCLSASILSGTRWTLIQYKLQQFKPPLQSTFATIRIFSPTMVFCMITLSLVLEHPWETIMNTNQSGYFESWRNVGWTLGIGVIGGILGVCMIVCEFYLIMKSNAVVLMIGGVVKELCTIGIGVFVFGDNFNTVNLMGCIIVFAGISVYKISNHLQKLKEKGDQYLSVDVSQEGHILDDNIEDLVLTVEGRHEDESDRKEMAYSMREID